MMDTKKALGEARRNAQRGKEGGRGDMTYRQPSSTLVLTSTLCRCSGSYFLTEATRLTGKWEELFPS